MSGRIAVSFITVAFITAPYSEHVRATSDSISYPRGMVWRSIPWCFPKRSPKWLPPVLSMTITTKIPPPGHLLIYLTHHWDQSSKALQTITPTEKFEPLNFSRVGLRIYDGTCSSFGKLHLDIKSKNFVLNCRRDIMIIDFGFAETREDGLVLAFAKGTRPFCSTWNLC